MFRRLHQRCEPKLPSKDWPGDFFQMDLLDIYDESDDEDDVAIERQRSSEYGRVRVVHQHEKRGNFPRSVPHTAGSWAGHIFLRLSSLEVTNESVGGWKQWLSKANWSGDIVLHDDFHVSLSRPFYLQEAFISSFVSHLETSVKEVPVFSLIVEKQQRVLENDDKRRSFLVQSIQFSASLMKLIHLVDDVMLRIGHSLY